MQRISIALNTLISHEQLSS